MAIRSSDPALELIALVLVPGVKITVPSLPSGFVARAELCAGLDAGAGAELALVCAPAGYGKTLLLADWSRTSTGVDTAWVGVDRDDNDPRRLWAAVVAAIAGCPSVPLSSRLHGRWAWRAGAQPEFLAELAEAVQALPQPLRLILDDVHELVDPVALHGVEILTRIKPATLQLVLSSRLDPPLSLSRLRLRGRLRELRAAQLAFTPAQAAQLLEQSGLRLSPQQVEVLHRRTGGWAAGLRLAARAMEQSADREAFLTHFSGDDRSVADYLVGEILSEVIARLRAGHSPDQVAGRLRHEHSGQHAERVVDTVSHEAIYTWIYALPKGELARQGILLRSGRTRRRARGRSSSPGARIVGMTSIDARPAEASDRAVPGAWEGDLVIGKAGRSAMATLVERTSRYTVPVALPAGRRDAPSPPAMPSSRPCPACPHSWSRPSPGTRAARWPATPRSASRPLWTSTSRTRTRRGNAAPTRTPTGCCASTSPRAPRSPTTRPTSFARRFLLRPLPPLLALDLLLHPGHRAPDYGGGAERPPCRHRPRA